MSSAPQDAARDHQRLDDVRGVGIAALRTAMVLLAVSAGTDWLFAHLGRHATVATALEGLVLTALPVAGLLAPARAAALLTPPGRTAIIAAVFAGAGALDIGVQAHFAEVASGIVFLGAVVSSPAWVAGTFAISAGGYLVDLLIADRSQHWIASATTTSAVATQLADLALNGLVGVLLVALLRRFLTGVPALLDAVRAGAPATTAELAAAVAGGRPLLPRADPAALIETLTPAECAVLELLAAGRVPKQAAAELHVQLSTVRSHIKAAKRKTGARTLEQLVALVAEAGAHTIAQGTSL